MLQTSRWLVAIIKCIVYGAIQIGANHLNKLQRTIVITE